MSRRLPSGRRIGFGARALSLAMALATIVSVRPAHGDPADIFSVAAPALGAEQPKAAPIMDGDASVATKTGALEYGYPIDVPPGRNGMRPHLALTYSSQSPIYGGLAAGWTLSIPAITLDTTQGRLLQTVREARIPKLYTSTMAGGRPLIETSELRASDVLATSRAQNDTSFTRYERVDPSTGYYWRAHATDGTDFFFGDTDHVGTCTNVSDENAPLTREVDAFGNAVEYFYDTAVDGECRIITITWGQNANAGLPVGFNSVGFNYTATAPTCAGIPIGSQTSYRTGTKIVTGASQLDSIVVAVGPDQRGQPALHQRVVTLGYDAEAARCDAPHAAYRALRSIQESAWGVDSPRVDLQPVTFSYGSASLVWPTETPHALPWAPTSFGSGHTGYNLGWGYRFNSPKWPTVEAMMVDIDGDGRIDRLTVDPIHPPNDTLHTAACGASWERNLGNLHFGPPQHIFMPTLKWAPVDPGDPFTGGAYATQRQVQGDNESCSLNYQQTAYANTTPATLVGVPCPQDADVGCPASGYCSNGDDCEKIGVVHDTVLAFRWIDIDGDHLVDLVASPAQGGLVNYNFQRGSGLPGHILTPDEPKIFGDFPPCPRSVTADPTGPYTMCGGMYPWIVYKNHGNGNFGTVSNGETLPSEILYQPMALETASGDSAITSRPVGQDQAIVDLDGDGYDDVAENDHDQGTNWTVFRNDGTGQLRAAFVTPFQVIPYTMTTPQPDRFSYSNTIDYGPSNAVNLQGLLDLNGDGLQDHWTSSGSGATFDLNDGADLGMATATTALRPGTDGLATILTFETPGSPYVAQGFRGDSSRLVDLDRDGRMDLVQFPAGTSSPVAHFNQGGEFGDAAGVVGDGFGLVHTIVVNDQFPFYWETTPPRSFAWELRADMIDLDGDGIAEGVNFDFANQPGQLGGTMYLSRLPTPAAPPRLLVGIDNHRGATTSIAYAPITDPAVVEEHPELGQIMPSTQWVVQHTTTTDVLAGTVATTSYAYKNPRFSPDDLGHWAFRGFDEVQTTRPSGAKTIERFRYDPDWSGRLVTAIVEAGGLFEERDADGPVTIDDTTWEQRDLFGGTVHTFHAIVRDHWTCPRGHGAPDAEAVCRSTAANRRRSVSTLAALSSTTNTGDPTPLLWQETQTILQAGETFGDGDRLTTTTFTLHADPTTYRLRPLVTTKQQQVAGSLVTFAKTAQTWDATDRVPLTDEVWFDDDDAHRAITRRVYDMTTGNVLERWKPAQNEAATSPTRYTYDDHALFVTGETNELGHHVDYITEPGTGTRLATIGPNQATCAMPATCPPGTLPAEQHRIRIDGLGRMIERFETFSDDGSSYTSYRIETNAYDDSAFDRDGIATSVTHQRALDVIGGMVVYADDESEQDGHGRPTRRTVFVHGTAPVDQITTFQYRDDGTLASVTLPDPSRNDASTVRYEYAFDSTGRPTSIRRPDAAAGSHDRSGIDLRYDGLSTTTREVVGAAGGQAASSTAVRDRYDRLVEVDEQLDLGPAFATTLYTYSPDDNVRTVVDPEGVTTALAHDFAGHRTRIERGSRVWKYGYDKNGNMVSEQVPGSPNPPLSDAAFTTTFAYDDLDRVASKLIGQRDLEAADQALFASGTEVYSYDAGPNQTGSLSSWRTFAPGSMTPAITLDLGNNAQGQRTRTTETLAIAGYPALSRELDRDYYLDGGARMTFYGDSVEGINATASRVERDARGLPSSIVLSRTGKPDQTLAVQTRNVAGLVTKRRSDVATAMGFIESNWTYDPLGRVTSQVVQKGSDPAQVVRQDLAYLGNDDPSSLDHWLGATNHKHFEFAYDLRHQLTGVTETAAGGAFSASYAYGPAGRFAQATEAALALPGSEVKPRDVGYRYEGTDPEEVTALVGATDGAPYANYEYDEAGNQTFRCEGVMEPHHVHRPHSPIICNGDSADFFYDGKDQMRRATKMVKKEKLKGSEEYWYDAFGQRVATLQRDKTGAPTELIWWLDDSEAHYDEAGNLLHVYSYLSLGTPVARVDRRNNDHTKLEFQSLRPREQHPRRGRRGRHDQRELRLRAVRRDHRVRRRRRQGRAQGPPPAHERQVRRRGQRAALLRVPLLRPDRDDVDPGRSALPLRAGCSAMGIATTCEAILVLVKQCLTVPRSRRALSRPRVWEPHH